MNLKEYISSGILELYAAGSLPDNEAREVEADILLYPELKNELREIQNALESYSLLYKKNPAPELRQSVLDKINELEDENFSRKPANENTIRPDHTELNKSFALQHNIRPAKYNYLMAAVWVFLILNILGNIYFFNRLKNTEDQLVNVLDENKNIKKDYEVIRDDFEKKTADLKMVMNRSNKVVDLKGMDIAPQAFATVYWNPKSRHVMLNVENLPMPPKDMQYQLWAIKNGKSVNAGVFDMKPGTEGDMHLMPMEISDADAFAVTLENMGGSTEPSMKRMYVMGRI